MNHGKKIALYGYGLFGKSASESFRLYWGDEYLVTAIFDRYPSGKTDPFWGLEILPADRILPAFENGVFESVMICVTARDDRTALFERFEKMGIPLFFPGKVEDFASPECFDPDPSPEITVRRDHYRFHVYKNMLAAVADFNPKNFLFLFNEQGLVNIDNKRKYLDYFEPYLLTYPFRLKNPIPQKIIMKGSYCLIAKTYSMNYWHFTIEVADCVYLMEKAGYTGKYIYQKKSFADQLLSMLGVTPDRLISLESLEQHKVYVFERLYDINHEGIARMMCSTEVMSEMASEIRSGLTRKTDSPRKLYVKRIGIRQLLNGDEIARRNGFTVIVPENYSLREQMELFYNADIVFSPHGANCTNFLYMREGTVFIEILPDRWYMDVNHDTCEACGVHYMKLRGIASETDTRDGQYADFYVDENALQDLIDQAESLIEAKR